VWGPSTHRSDGGLGHLAQWQAPAPDAGGSEEACLAWLKQNNIPLDRGWLPELPRCFASAESFVEIKDDRFEQ
jgi:hypothetical protein